MPRVSIDFFLWAAGDGATDEITKDDSLAQAKVIHDKAVKDLQDQSEKAAGLGAHLRHKGDGII